MIYCEILNNGSEDDKLAILKKAGGFYRIARNLPSKYDEKKNIARYKPVLNIIDNLKHSYFENNTVEKIREIKSEISKEYGNRNVLSLTTKFLWIKIKQPILIYDSQARIAIGAKYNDLNSYYDKWHDGFIANKDEIAKVCSNLPKLHKYAVNQDVGTEAYIQDLASKSWFHERVFDIYLWNKGAKV
jgi:hypothetical protein